VANLCANRIDYQYLCEQIPCPPTDTTCDIGKVTYFTKSDAAKHRLAYFASLSTHCYILLIVNRSLPRYYWYYRPMLSLYLRDTCGHQCGSTYVPTIIHQFSLTTSAYTHSPPPLLVIPQRNKFVSYHSNHIHHLHHFPSQYFNCFTRAILFCCGQSLQSTSSLPVLTTPLNNVALR